MFRIGLNPYGFAHTVGLQAFGTPRANREGTGLRGFIAIAGDVGARCLEFDGRWLAPLRNDELAALAGELPPIPRLCSYWLQHVPGETLDEAIRATRAIGGTTIRIHLTPILEGARAKQGAKWPQIVAHARETLNREARKAADVGLDIAIENHQDFGSDELIAFAEEAGTNVGIALDTGNAFAVAEDPVAFAKRVASRIKHLHLKDYVSQFTQEGFRLIRCAIGDGCVPLTAIADVCEPRAMLTASIEVGALDARHIRVFAPDWWEGYPSRPVGELRTALDRLKTKRLDDNADYRTPWELNQPTAAVVEYEMGQLRRSVANLTALGWM
ncbi:MAG: sugar phosphate isomerase/epimerase family protein [Gemmatimonadaceae bacterium]